MVFSDVVLVEGIMMGKIFPVDRYLKEMGFLVSSFSIRAALKTSKGVSNWIYKYCT